MALKFKTTSGRLTAYSFGCGYVERKSTEDGLATTMWKENGCYHVRQVKFDGGQYAGRLLWEVFPSLTRARVLFDKQPGTLHQ